MIEFDKLPRAVKNLIIIRTAEYRKKHEGILPKDITRTRIIDYLRLKIDNSFLWKETREGHEFWQKIIQYEDISEFYKLYPKKKGKKLNLFK